MTPVCCKLSILMSSLAGWHHAWNGCRLRAPQLCHTPTPCPWPGVTWALANTAARLPGSTAMAKETFCRSAAQQDSKSFHSSQPSFQTPPEGEALPGPGPPWKCALTGRSLPVVSAAERSPLLTQGLHTLHLHVVVRQ